ncbi:MAG: hypothetical protein JSU00_09620 [Acidobacteria bacterium]|nr:hypothetical protein [Acidobacteriota bacterium]
MKLKKATAIPKFKNLDEEVAFWETHSTEELIEHLTPAPPVKLPAAQIESIHNRAAGRKQAISIRLDSGQIAAAKRIAARKSIGYQTQLRMWIAEGLERDA